MRLQLIVLLSPFILSSCIGTRYLEKGETLLYKQEVKGDGSNMELSTFYTQTPNTRTLFSSVAPFVHFYGLGSFFFDSARLVKEQVNIVKKNNLKINKTNREKRKAHIETKKLRKVEKIDQKLTEGNWLMKLGEPIAVYSPVMAAQTLQKMKDYLFSKGFFDAKVGLSTRVRGKVKQMVTYQVDPGSPYVMDSVIRSVADQRMRSILLKAFPVSPLKGKVYDQDVLGAERDNIYDLMSDNGYFDFKKQYISFEVDTTTLDENRLVVRETIATAPYKVYRIDSVVFIAQGSGRNKVKKEHVRSYNRITYDFTRERYPRRVLDWRMFIYPDSLYSKSNTIETQKQLSYLDIFKFVNINYDTTNGHFIANIFTSPLKKYQTSSELGLSFIESTSQGQGYPGPFLNFNAKTRNLFHSLEILSFDASASIQGISNVAQQGREYSRFQYGAQLSITYPQMILPLHPAIRGRLGKYNPRTKVAFGINFEDRISEYKRITLNNSLNYLFQVNTSSQISIKPIEISLIQSDNSQSFKRILDSLERQGNISYVSAFKSAFVSSSAVSVDYNSGGYGFENINSFFVRSSVEYGGLAQLLFGSTPFSDSLTHYKYVKTNVDFRKNFRLTRQSALACRINVGLAYVYGASRSLPYEKYFFTGGSTSIRAWSPRRLGPGAYASYSHEATKPEATEIDYRREQPGDLIFEASMELRDKLYRRVDYAVFLDAGNVWLWKSKTLNTTEDPQGDDGKFRMYRALNELAVGVGAGLRLDLSFLVLRLDMAVKVFDPGEAAGSRFVLDSIRPSNIDKKTTLNIGIGYPF